MKASAEKKLRRLIRKRRRAPGLWIVVPSIDGRTSLPSKSKSSKSGEGR